MPRFNVSFHVRSSIPISGRQEITRYYELTVDAENQDDALEMVQNNWSDYTGESVDTEYHDATYDEDEDYDAGDENEFEPGGFEAFELEPVAPACAASVPIT